MGFTQGLSDFHAIHRSLFYTGNDTEASWYITRKVSLLHLSREVYIHIAVRNQQILSTRDLVTPSPGPVCQVAVLARACV